MASFYSLLVVRLSLDYLGKQQYGLLSLVAQVSTYIAILDFGLTVAFGRILIDYTTGSKERYASALRTATVVFNLLGVLGFLIAVAVTFLGIAALSIPTEFQQEFKWLMLAQGAFIYTAFGLKPLSSPLIANGRHHVVYWIGTATMAVNGAVFWLALRGGIGIYSSLVGTAAATILSGILLWMLSRPYRPTAGIKGRFDSCVFRDVLTFSRDSMVWQIGGQTIVSLPIFLASAWFALSAAADISAGMKLVMLAIAVCTRFGDMSVTPLSIEFARGNETTAVRQMTRIAGISGGIGVFATIYVTCANPSFLNWWMLGKVSWSWHENLAASLWIAILSVSQCLYGYAVISRQMKIIRWALIYECIIYVSVAYLSKFSGGAASLLWAKPVASILIAVFVAWRISKNTRFDTLIMLPVAIRQAVVLTILLIPAIHCSTWLANNFHTPLLAFVATSALAALLSAIAFPFLFTKEMIQDLKRTFLSIIQKLPKTKNHPKFG